MSNNYQAQCNYVPIPSLQIFYSALTTLNVTFTWTVLAHDEVHWLKADLSERGPEVWSVVQNDVVGVGQVGVDRRDPVVQPCEVFIKEELKIVSYEVRFN